MRWARFIAALAAFGLAGLACSKESADGTVTVTFERLPDLQARAPAETRVADNAMGIGVMLKGPGVSMTISPFRNVDASNLDEAKKKAEAYSPTNLREVELPDGFILTYESDGTTGTTYWLVGRRELEGVPYSCGVSSPKKEHQQSAIAICKSLKK